MTPDELTVTLKNLQKNQLESHLVALECQARIFALETVLIALDNRAVGLLEQQIAVERDKLQKQRESFQLAIRLLQTSAPTKPS